MRLKAITYKDLNNIHWPVYVIPHDLMYEDGLFTSKGRIIDDRNQPGETLGLRRLQTTKKLFTLRRAVVDLPSLVQSSQTRFIDWRGNAFQYKRTNRAVIKYCKIKRVERKDTASLLWVIGEELPLLIPRPPPPDYLWAGVAYLSSKYPSVVFDYSVRKLPDIKRRL